MEQQLPQRRKTPRLYVQYSQQPQNRSAFQQELEHTRAKLKDAFSDLQTSSLVS